MAKNSSIWEKLGISPTIQLFLRARILVQVTIYRRLLIGRDSHLDQSEAYDISYLYENTGPVPFYLY